MNKSFDTQCNLTKCSTLIINEYYRQCYLFNFWNLHCTFLCKKCDKGYYVIKTMVFTEEDHVVIKFLYQYKGYSTRCLLKEFPLKIGKLTV